MKLQDYTLEELQTYLVERGYKKFAAKQIFEGFYKRGKTIEDISNIAKNLKEHLLEEMEVETLELVEKNVASDMTTKFLFKLNDGNLIETVLMKFNYGYSVCVSTQIGCNMGCKFCASGQEKKRRDLTTAEIVEQVRFVNNLLLKKEERVSHIVVMGIGEPFDNFTNTISFIEIVNQDIGMQIGKRNITVSTSGLVEKIIEFSKLESQVNLAISLHAPNDDLRSEIMPINNKYNLKKLMSSIREYFKNSNRRITIEYILLKGINDSDQNAKELAQLLRGMNVYVNIIPYNKVVETGYERSPRKDQFAKILVQNKINTTLRKEKGSDIDAACGQLRILRGK